jgi:cytochrome P450
MQAARSLYTRSDWYRGFRLAPGVDNVLSMTDDKLHAKRRAQMNMGFSGKENGTLESTIDHHITNFVSLICQKYISSSSVIRPMDLARKAQYFTLDVIVDVAAGAPFGDLIHDKDCHEYLESTANSLPAIAMVSSVPWAGKLLQHPWIGKLVSPSGTEEKGIGKVIRFVFRFLLTTLRLFDLMRNHRIVTKMVTERFSLESKKRIKELDMLQSFINHGITQEEAIFESIITILGGSDTMAIAIRAIMLFIITNPHVYRKLQTEIDEAMKTGAISDPVIKDSEARELPYLQAVIREGLRIFPPGTGQMPKLSPPEGDTVNGIFIPGGVRVGTNPWAIMRSPENFGPDSEVFRPERWLEASPQRRMEMEYVLELVWAYGKYKCLGQSIAMMELNKIFFEVCTFSSCSFAKNEEIRN